MTQKEINESEWRDPRNWQVGWLGVYYARRDTRIFVPKRNRWLGFTLNFAHPQAVLVSILLLIVVVGAVVGSIFK